MHQSHCIPAFTSYTIFHPATPRVWQLIRPYDHGTTGDAPKIMTNINRLWLESTRIPTNSSSGFSSSHGISLLPRYSMLRSYQTHSNAISLKSIQHVFSSQCSTRSPVSHCCNQSHNSNEWHCNLLRGSHGSLDWHSHFRHKFCCLTHMMRSWWQYICIITIKR